MAQLAMRSVLALLALLCLIPTWQILGPDARAKLHRLAPGQFSEGAAAAHNETVSLEASPLSSAPFLTASLDEARQVSDRIHIAETGLDRDPRNLGLWMVQAELAMQNGNWTDAVHSLDRLYFLDTAQRDLYLQALHKIARSPDGRAALSEMLTPDTAWGARLLRLMVNEGRSTEELLPISRKVKGGTRPLIDTFVRQGDYDRAFLVWLGAIETNDQAFAGWPFNPSFIRSDAPRPFNWSLSPSAEYETDGGLYVRYEGKDTPTLASQTVMLGPGTYTLASEHSIETRPEAGHMRWRLRCLSDPRTDIASIDLDGSVSATTTSIFVVPERDCPVQELSLMGAPGEFPQMSRATIMNVTFRSAADAETDAE